MNSLFAGPSNHPVAFVLYLCKRTQSLLTCMICKGLVFSIQTIKCLTSVKSAPLQVVISLCGLLHLALIPHTQHDKDWESYKSQVTIKSRLGFVGHFCKTCNHIDLQLDNTQSRWLVDHELYMLNLDAFLGHFLTSSKCHLPITHCGLNNMVEIYLTTF